MTTMTMPMPFDSPRLCSEQVAQDKPGLFLERLSATGRIHVDSVVKDLQSMRNSAEPISKTRKISLVELLVEETKFLRIGGVKSSTIVPILMEKVGASPDGPLGQAAYLVSLKAEETTDQPHYHNLHHVVEVAVAAFVLGRREGLPMYRIAELIIAAAAHDLGHTGQMNRHDYEREQGSFDIARPLLEQASLPSSNIERIRQMILATDFRVGVSLAR